MFSQVTYPCGKYFIEMNGTSSNGGTWNQAYNYPNITLASWVKLTDPSFIGRRMMIFSRYDFDSGENTDYELAINESGMFVFKSRIDQMFIWDSVIFNVKPQLNVWYHVAVTFDGTTHECKTYINGIGSGSKTFAGSLSYIVTGSYASHYISFGYKDGKLAGYSGYFKGYLDEAAYCSIALTANSVKTLAQGIAPGDAFLKDNNVIIYHKFNDYPSQPNYGIGLGTLPTNGQYHTCPVVNKPPVANAGPDQTITLPLDIVSLSGTATPGTGSIINSGWKKMSGPAGGVISDPASLTPDVTNLQEGTYIFELTITDDNSLTGTDDVSINVMAATKEIDISKCPGTIIDISGIINRADFLNVFWTTAVDNISIDPTHVDIGHFLLRTTLDNLKFNSTNITVSNYPKPDLGPDTTQVFCPSTFINEYDHPMPLDTTGYNVVGWFTLSGIPVNPTLVPFENVHLIVKNNFGCLDTASIAPVAFPVLNILPAEPQVRIANRETPDGFDPNWTNYYYDFNDNTGRTYLLLSIKTKDYPNVGHVGDGTFEVKEVATLLAGSGTAIKINNPYIINPDVYAMNRYWSVKVDPAKEPGQEVGVRFYYTNQDFNDLKSSIPGLKDANSIVDNNNLYFYVVHGANPDPNSNFDGVKPNYLGNGVIPATNTWVDSLLGCGEHRAEFTVTTFSGGGGGATVNGQTLPLILKSFTIVLQNKNSLINWQTAQQINTDHFIIERSSDGHNFSLLSFVNANGNSSVVKNYSFTDLQTLPGISYYRLKIVDADGEYTYSKVIAIKNDGSNYTVKIFPNPAQGSLFIQARGLNDWATLQVFDVSGRKLKEERILLNGDTHTLNIKNLSKGVYNLFVKGKIVNEHQKFVKE